MMVRTTGCGSETDTPEHKRHDVNTGHETASTEEGVEEKLQKAVRRNRAEMD